MFVPPFCPFVSCVRHATPGERFYRSKGCYRSSRRDEPIPRFICRSCGRSFSRQTFRADYRLKRHDLTKPIWLMLSSGVSQRQCARVLGVDRKLIDDRLVRFGRHAIRLHDRVTERLVPKGRFQFDEIETFESSRITKPLTVGLLLEQDSLYVIGTSVGKLRTRVSGSAASRRRREEYEQLHGRRKNGSRRVVRSLLRRLRVAMERSNGPVELRITTDEKKTYPILIREMLGEDIHHETVSSRAPRNAANPLFPINHLEAMIRYGVSRFIRRSWCAAKRAASVSLHLAIYSCWKNLVRRRTNEDDESAAMMLGLTRRRLTPNELFEWRLDFRKWMRISGRIGES
jgi:transposase-like protein